MEYSQLERDASEMKSAQNGWFNYTLASIFFVMIIEHVAPYIRNYVSVRAESGASMAILAIGLCAFILQFRKHRYVYYRNRESGKLEFGVRIPAGEGICTEIDRRIEETLTLGKH